MMLPSTLKNKTEWTFLGPMGPELPPFLSEFPVMGVDGGANFAQNLSMWVGDSDSIDGEVNCPNIYRHSTEKDQSDLALALSFFREPCHYKFHFWGFLGGRKDHELFNFGEALTFLEEHPECQILFYDGDSKICFHLLGGGDWKMTHSGLFSLGTLKKATVKLTGQCQYPIYPSQILEPLSSHGLSNRASGEVELQTDAPVFYYFPEGK